ncbi:MAG: HAD-IC family P-type ATPase, partial [Cyanobacteria bacterium Co-bin13]|nr:HAD-IC family P-type ATPase [Cyanobacteria bacterium Co-bin13]
MNNLADQAFGGWHTVAPDEALTQLQSDRTRGLSPELVAERQQTHGPNELEEAASRSGLRIFLDQFTNIMLLMLIAVAIVSGVLALRHGNMPRDAIAIFAIVILNGVLGYFQESRAEKALAALKQMAAPNVRVIRDGRLTEVPARELVPGDVMLLEAGVQVAADGRLLEAVNLQVRESALTGEAHTVNKQAQAALTAETPLADRKNLVYQGTEVVQGRGQVLVTQIGMQTELGRIAAMLQSVQTEPTPLQHRMDQLGNALVSGSLFLVALVVIGGVLSAGWGAFESLLEVSLSMAVAVVPEGLPAVITVTLAIGTQRMVRRHALIRRLPAVETLGSVTTICSDKTGTLTQNKMVVQQIRTPACTYQVTGEGYAPKGEFLQGGQPVTPAQNPDLNLLLLDGLLCNDAVLQKERGEWAVMGDPTEGALVVLACKGDLDYHGLIHGLKRAVEFPFSSERKRMSVVVDLERATLKPQLLPPQAAQAAYLLLAKGSPELLLDCCSQVFLKGQARPLEGDLRSQILTDNEQMASRGLRVLGFAYRPLMSLPSESEPDTAEQQLIWLGLVGMIDAARPEVKQAVQLCRAAGVRPMMITGDHPLTAQVLAEDLGITSPDSQALSGVELERLSQSELEAAVKTVNVYARVSPEHKLRLVQA